MSLDIDDSINESLFSANLESPKFHGNTPDISQPTTPQAVLPLGYMQTTAGGYITHPWFKAADLCDSGKLHIP